ncbi:PKD domain-containing protein [Pyxidicoccus xibeiensis]|uniref:PKD domain-containing protein n=1 Tax=Pyxidicoccus xibeiensis TaxID=2906759 RepID=UPI0020A7CC85|nr:PKD domain-containing protein [Pyxidicoccus xibeiensis]MCP3143758.1 PKD domain-containing protein [Pyxidicoccus xibeiensis]
MRLWPHPRLRAVLVALLALASTGLGACDTTPSPPPRPPDLPPLLRLVRPEAASAVRVGQPVDFEATVEDAEDGASLSERVLWFSSLEGQLARGARITAAFREPGDHTLTATVMDSAGQAASASMALRVLAVGAPVATVVRPEPGSTFNLGEVLDLECAAFTQGGARLTGGAVQWTSALSGRLPQGESVKAALVVAGEDTLTCTARDAATGASTTTSVRVTVRTILAPAVLITRPEQAELYVKSGEPAPFSSTVLFRATAQDFNTAGGAGNLDGAIHWSLEPGGVALGTGPAVAHTFTMPGDYTVTARVVDGRGNAATDSVRVLLVTNLPPRCEIDTPVDNARLLLGASSPLRGRCLDPETGYTLMPTWRTSASPMPLGSGEQVDAILTVAGAQTLSACALDPEDAEVQGCTTRAVRAFVNSAPTDCAIQEPLAAAVVNAGRAVVLAGTATDAETPRGELRFAWTSSRDGELGLGERTSTQRLLTPGAHVLTLTVTDAWGLACTATVGVSVNGAPSVRVDAVRQDGVDCLEEPCREGRPLDVLGFVQDPEAPGSIAGLTWLDSLGGRLEAGDSSMSGLAASPIATLAAPGPGRHTVVLLVEDRNGSVGRAAATFTVLTPGRTRLVETVTDDARPAVALALSGGTLRYVDGASAMVFSEPPRSEPLPVSAPALALFSLTGGGGGEVLFVGTDGGGVHRCEGGTCARFAGGPLAIADDRVTAVAALATPDLLLLGTPRGLVVTRASNPSAGGRPGILVGRRLLEGREVRQVVLSPASTATQVKAWAATSTGLAELTVHVEDDFEPALASVTVAMHLPPQVLDADVRAVAVGPAGQVFTGTRRGFSALGQPGPALRDAPWALPDEEVHALLFERQPSDAGMRGVLWAGMKDGLVRYDVERDIVTRFGAQEGLPAAKVQVLVAGPDGTRYIGTSHGVAKYSGR